MKMYDKSNSPFLDMRILCWNIAGDTDNLLIENYLFVLDDLLVFLFAVYLHCVCFVIINEILRKYQIKKFWMYSNLFIQTIPLVF